jgi:hypothetical protein
LPLNVTFLRLISSCDGERGAALILQGAQNSGELVGRYRRPGGPPAAGIRAIQLEVLEPDPARRFLLARTGRVAEGAELVACDELAPGAAAMLLNQSISNVIISLDVTNRP